MHKWLRRIAVIASLAIVALSLGTSAVTNTAKTAIPRSMALDGAPQSTDGSTNILLLGLDSRRDNNGKDLPRALLDLMHVGSSSSIGGYNTNTMILIHIPAGGKKAVAISIPRDDYVQVPGLGGRKIKEAYGLAKYYKTLELVKQGVSGLELERKSREAGRTATIKTVSQLLNVPIDHFAEVNLVGFYHLSIALDGVQVCLKHAVDDHQYSGAVFPAGLQTLKGVDALKFVRQRHGLPNGDLDRTHRQQAFITGVITKFRTQGIFGNLSKLSALLDVAKQDVVIDDGWDVIGFLPNAKALTGGNITFHTLPIVKYGMINSQSVNIIDTATVNTYVQNLFYPKVTATPKATSTTPAKKKVVKVGTNGLPVEGSGIPCVN